MDKIKAALRAYVDAQHSFGSYKEAKKSAKRSGYSEESSETSKYANMTKKEKCYTNDNGEKCIFIEQKKANRDSSEYPKLSRFCDYSVVYPSGVGYYSDVNEKGGDFNTMSFVVDSKLVHIYDNGNGIIDENDEVSVVFSDEDKVIKTKISDFFDKY